MFDVQKFYEDAEAGRRPDLNAFKEYVRGFENVIIWGAGNLGTALGKAFLGHGLNISVYWDMDYENIKLCNGIAVTEPFSGDHNKDNTLIVIGIVNGTLSHTWQKGVLESKGYYNYLFGMQTYEAIACKEEIGKPFDVRECVNTSICNFNTCKRYMNIVRNGREKTGLTVQVLEIILSSRCTLDCKYCGQQAGETKRRFPEKYRDYPAEDIKHSIDVVMDRLDAVGTFSIIGGEAFIHPKFAEILKHCLTKDNVAIISITTNGVCDMSEELLNEIKNDKIKINFSNYTDSLSDMQKKLFHENVERVKRAGIACNISTPIWVINTDELRDNPDFRDETLDNRKSACVFGPSIAGKYLYACPQTERQFRMEVHDVEDDIIDLNNEKGLTDRLRELLNKTHYTACQYLCSNMKTTRQIPPGEQWRDED
ncbi:radical SAM protein [Butyrivibrio sp. INlla16]|uniref:radical SAM protein n=1 Tax=Butyrivibrio sp. INlla16 TaxID=1520807 RepID=UPI00088095A4|nr:radical SAM protein [Butyrivibrio sp. INlla16]SDB60294.1 4Fe-4S single cluster domain-containing protein [Butyrivibrio sp. INlla16]